MAKSKSSRRWLERHFDDPYVQRAQREGYRSRAAFKLLEIQEKDHLIRPGQVVVDLGAAPGGWSQVVVKLVGPKGLVLATDILPMEPLPGVDYVQGDFREAQVLEAMADILKDRRVDLVISDMLPNVTGVAAVDQPRAMHLCELTLDYACQNLMPGGNLLLKVYQGEGFDAFLRRMREAFAKVQSRKPMASRSISREVYLLGRDKKL